MLSASLAVFALNVLYVEQSLRTEPEIGRQIMTGNPLLRYPVFFNFISLKIHQIQDFCIFLYADLINVTYDSFGL